ncbi:MAG TPA: hypothetical protein VMJ10_23035 [Kofleriaceae bacterium]|nr:hypothetical protein [Kofleriaceae bacterium]
MRTFLLVCLVSCSGAVPSPPPPAQPATCSDTSRAETERDRVLANERVLDPRLFECDDRNCRLGELCIDHSASALTECRTIPRTGACYALPPECRELPTCACAARAVADRDPKATEESCTDAGGHVTFAERDD